MYYDNFIKLMKDHFLTPIFLPENILHYIFYNFKKNKNDYITYLLLN